MAMATAKKQEQRKERLEARVTSEFKARLMLACNISGKSVTDFIVEHLGQAAREVIAEHTQWKLAQEDSAIFVETLLNQKPLGEHLKKAAQLYHREIGDFQAQ